MTRLHATFITSVSEPLRSWLASSIIGRAHKNNILSSEIISILESVSGNHHKIDDTPYGGGPGELMRIDIIAPLIKQALSHKHIAREKKRVILMDPAGTVFSQQHAVRLASYQELIFISGRYEGLDARVNYYIDESLSLGDFILSSGDLAAMAIFDATARMLDGVLGNSQSISSESHMNNRLECSQYTRPLEFEGHRVPQVLTGGNHKDIEEERRRESIIRTVQLRHDFIKKAPLSEQETKLLMAASDDNYYYPWQSLL